MNRIAEPWLVVFGLLWGTIGTGCTGQNDSRSNGAGMNAQLTQDSIYQPFIEFDTLRHDFGTILEGERVLCYFDYENRGGGELVIQSVEASCGCTIVDWSKEPLAPGAKDHLQVVFDATGRSGIQLKLVTVMTNASNPRVQLTLKADVKTNV